MKIEVTHLNRSFGKVAALSEVSFSFGTGDVFGFIGPNGAGKTTAMRIIATLDRPDSGDVLCDGVSILDYPERARRVIGYMPDQLPANRDIKVWEYLDFFARAAGLRGQGRSHRLQELEEFTGVGPIRGKYLAALSKGMKQRVSLARALIHSPEILILDEPAAGLDPRARFELREQIRTLSERGTAILISSHILSELEDICNGVVIIERGRILQSGRICDLHSAAAAPEFRVLEISVSGDVEAAVRIARELSGEARRNSTGAFLWEVKGAEPEAALAVAKLIDAGVVVSAFRPADDTIEELFMKVTAGKVQ